MRTARGRLAVAILVATATTAAAIPAAVVASSSSAALEPRQARIFAQVCARCHVRPGLGIPVVGDDAAWAPLREKGIETLVAHTVEGFGNMPPLGTCGYCSERDLRLLVAFMAGLPSARASGPP